MELPDLQQAIDELERRGCRLERSPAGVALLETSLACWQDVLQDRALRLGRTTGRRTMVFARTTSTNDVALHQAGAPDVDGLVVLADEQTAGRGRPGHGWSANAGQSVLLSLVIGRTRVAELNRLTILAGLAVALALEQLLERAGFPARSVEIKWPNDLLIRGKKVAGILVERRPGAPDAEAPAVIGVGVNVRQAAEDFPLELRGRATSLFDVGVDPAPDRLEVAVCMLDFLSGCCQRPETSDAQRMDAWKLRCPLLGKLVTVRSGGATMTGHVEDISPLHGLIMKDAAGAIHFLSAQTSSLL